MKVDLSFPLRGERIPQDHGYPLYSAVAAVVEAGEPEWLHHQTDVAIHPVSGVYLSDGHLRLKRGSAVRVRCHTDDLPRFLPLSGKKLELAGCSLRLGVCHTSALQPATTVYARRVTTRNGEDETRFVAEIARQLATLDIRGKPVRGQRRVLRIKDKTIVAHGLLVTELTADESIRLQEEGLGGRRKMGCGVFVPWRG